MFLAILLATIAPGLGSAMQVAFAQDKDGWYYITSAKIEQEVIQRNIGCSDACSNTVAEINSGSATASRSGASAGSYITSAIIEQEAPRLTLAVVVHAQTL